MVDAEQEVSAMLINHRTAILGPFGSEGQVYIDVDPDMLSFASL